MGLHLSKRPNAIVYDVEQKNTSDEKVYCLFSVALTNLISFLSKLPDEDEKLLIYVSFVIAKVSGNSPRSMLFNSGRSFFINKKRIPI